MARPGPQFAIHDATAEKAVIMSVFKAINARVQTPKEPKYMTKNTEPSVMISSLTDPPLIFTCFTMRGLSILPNSRILDFNNKTILTHFMAPPVEPAHAPININKIIKNLQPFGHRSKSAEAWPVVEHAVIT